MNPVVLVSLFAAALAVPQGDIGSVVFSIVQPQDGPHPPHHPTGRPPHHPTGGPPHPPHHPTGPPHPPHHPTRGPPRPHCHHDKYDPCFAAFQTAIDFNITANATEFVEHLTDITADQQGLNETCGSVRTFVECARRDYDECTDPRVLQEEGLEKRDAYIYGDVSEWMKDLCAPHIVDRVLDSFDCVKENVTEEEVEERCGHHCHHTTTAAPEPATTAGSARTQAVAALVDEFLAVDEMLIVEHQPDHGHHQHHDPCRALQEHISCVPKIIGENCGKCVGGIYCDINRRVVWKLLGDKVRHCRLWCPRGPPPPTRGPPPTRHPHHGDE